MGLDSDAAGGKVHPLQMKIQMRLEEEKRRALEAGGDGTAATAEDERMSTGEESSSDDQDIYEWEGGGDTYEGAGMNHVDTPLAGLGLEVDARWDGPTHSSSLHTLHCLAPITEEPKGTPRGSCAVVVDEEAEAEAAARVAGVLQALGLEGQEKEAHAAATRIQAAALRWLRRGTVAAHTGHSREVAKKLLSRLRHTRAAKRMCGLEASMLYEARGMVLQQEIIYNTVRMASGRHSVSASHGRSLLASHGGNARSSTGGLEVGELNVEVSRSHSAHSPCMCGLCRVAHRARASDYRPAAGALVRHMGAMVLQAVWRGRRSRRATAAAAS